MKWLKGDNVIAKLPPAGEPERANRCGLPGPSQCAEPLRVVIDGDNLSSLGFLNGTVVTVRRSSFIVINRLMLFCHGGKCLIGFARPFGPGLVKLYGVTGKYSIVEYADLCIHGVVEPLSRAPKRPPGRELAGRGL